jgi:hypothetical protein
MLSCNHSGVLIVKSRYIFHVVVIPIKYAYFQGPFISNNVEILYSFIYGLLESGGIRDLMWKCEMTLLLYWYSLNILTELNNINVDTYKKKHL